MRNLVSKYVIRFRDERRVRFRLLTVVLALAVVVAGVVFWQLRYVGVAMANDYNCGYEEHIHDDSCYALELVCGQETKGLAEHTHDASCYETVRTLICGLEESDEEGGHIHDDSCYVTEEVLVCGLEETGATHVHDASCYEYVLVCDIPEHVHTVECLIDEEADVETAKDWEATLPELTGNYAYDVVSVARSQIGYRESETNFAIAEDGETRNGYTRYGAWYGNPYGDWDAMFASFCLYYANVPEEDFPQAAGVWAWIVELEELGLYADAAEAEPTPGDLVFLDADEDNEADTVAVVTAVDEDRLTVIQGDCEDAVRENEVTPDDAAIVGYGILPEQENAPEADVETADSDAEAADEEDLTEDDAEAVDEKDLTEEDAEAVDEEDLTENDAEAANEGDPAETAVNVGEVVPMVDQTGDVLDGDYAYLTSVGMETDSSGTPLMVTGTAPWDTTEGAGNDTTPNDSLLRTYDVATYTVTMTTKTRDEEWVYTTGDLYLELVVNGSAAEVQWETGSMGWLESKHGVYTVTTEEYGGQKYQVLRGHITLEPSQEGGHAIGETVQTLAIDLRALAMQNGDTLDPKFTFFFAYNDVGLTTEQYNAWGTEAYNGPIVTFEGKPCEEHGEAEWHTINGPKITISATPRYNIAIVNSTESKTQQMGSYDFSTGNDLALDKDAGEYYGRLGSYGLVLQIVGKSASDGLRGVELPAEGENLTVSFTLSLSSTYTTDGKTVYETGKTSDGQDLTKYAPLVWSFDVNKSGTSQQDNRSIPTSTKYADKVPYNKLSQTSDAYWYDSCADGGSWSIKDNKDGTYTVTITDCTVDTSQFPYVHPGAGTSLSYNYYNPNEINYSPNDPTKNSYWEVQTACISAGEMWVVQPYYAGPKDDNTDKENTTYISQILGEGNFSVTLTNTNLTITQGDKDLLNGASQSVTTDDSQSQSMALVNPGSIDQHIAYVKYDYASYNDPLTDGCFSSAKDWILQGDQLTIETYVTNDSAEEGNTGVAYDVMIKFDDAFFQPDGTIKYNGLLNSETRTTLWAAKPDKSGWDHGGLSPDADGYDDEMINATPDDLVYFSSLDSLENAGYTCVGVLVQYRGLMTEQQNHIHTYVKGSSKMSAEADQVYMVTPYCRSWDRDDLAAAMAADPNSGYETSSAALSALLSMSTTEVKTVVNQYIPTRTADNGAGTNFQYEDNSGAAVDYPSAHWINGDSRHPTTATGGSSRTPTILNYQKTWYDDSGCHERTTGNYYGDSCLMVGYTSGLTLKVAQQTSLGDGTTQDKYVFDLDTNQTVVDYEAIPFITRNNGEGSSETLAYTSVVVTVTLPSNLTYINGSSYIGGTYVTNGEGVQGTVTGGTKLTEGEETTFTYTVNGTKYTVGVLLTVSTDDDGNQVLTYTFTDFPVSGTETQQFLDEIYFSCEIWTNKVENGDQLEITAEIYCDSDKGVDPSLRPDGQATRGIAITKDSAVSLVKRADDTIVEINEDIGYAIDIGDDSPNDLTMIAVDALPYNGDSYCTFTNEDCVVCLTEFSAYDMIAERDLSSYFFFYTTNPECADVTSADYPGGAYFVTDFGTESAAVNPECLTKNGGDWVQMEMDMEKRSDGIEVFRCSNLPSAEDQVKDGQVYAVVGIGIVEGHDDITMHLTVSLSNPEPGDVVVNRITQQHAIGTTKGESTGGDSTGNGTTVEYENLSDQRQADKLIEYLDGTTVEYENLSDHATVHVIGRTVSGTVWLDEDLDGGIRTGMYDAEQLLSGVDVELQIRDEYGDWATAKDLKYGKECKTTTDESGYYEFKYLPEGEYRVLFSGTGVATNDSSGADAKKYVLAEHKVTAFEAEDIDTTVNSKVVRSDIKPADSSSDPNVSADCVSDISLPSKQTFYGADYIVYEDAYENGGYTKNVPFTAEKIWLDLDGKDITDQKTAGEIAVQITAEIQTADEELVEIQREITLNHDNGWTETIDDLLYYDGDGNPIKYTPVAFTVGEVKGSAGYVSTVGKVVEDEDGNYSVTVTNQSTKELPKTGGMGTWMYTTAGLLLITGAAYLLYQKTRRQRGSRKE